MARALGCRIDTVPISGPRAAVTQALAPLFEGLEPDVTEENIQSRLRGLLAGSLRSMTWAGYLVMLYLVVGVMEAWANPPQRIPALTQVLLVVLFIGSVLVFSRQVPRNREETDR